VNATTASEEAKKQRSDEEGIAVDLMYFVDRMSMIRALSRARHC
jgi:hypothetical protein